jgi:hypothetical protein
MLTLVLSCRDSSHIRAMRVWHRDETHGFSRVAGRMTREYGMLRAPRHTILGLGTVAAARLIAKQEGLTPFAAGRPEPSGQY